MGRRNCGGSRKRASGLSPDGDRGGESPAPSGMSRSTDGLSTAFQAFTVGVAKPAKRRFSTPSDGAPSGAPSEAAELQTSLAQLSRARRGRWLGPLWRTGRAAAGARELITPWAPLLPLVNVPFLVATLASALATPFLVLGALAMLAVYG